MLDVELAFCVEPVLSRWSELVTCERKDHIAEVFSVLDTVFGRPYMVVYGFAAGGWML